MATADLASVPRNNVSVTTGPLHSLRFALNNEADMVMPQQLNDAERALLNYLTVDEDKVHSIKSHIRDQAMSGQWKKERTYRFTASNFHLISKRQRNHESFA